MRVAHPPKSSLKHISLAYLSFIYLRNRRAFKLNVFAPVALWESDRMMSSMNTHSSSNEKKAKSTSAVLFTLSRLFSVAYLVLLTYFIMSNDNEELEPINDNMIFYLTLRVIGYWIILIFWFLAMNFSVFSNSFHASQQYFGEMYRGILPFWRRPKSRSLHEVLVINKDIEHLEGGGIQVELLKATQAILCTDKWTEDCHVCLRELVQTRVPVTVLVSNASILRDIQEFFQAQHGDYFVVALDSELAMSQSLSDDANAAFQSRPLRHLLCPCSGIHRNYGEHKYTQQGEVTSGRFDATVFLLDPCARVAWYGPPNKCATDVCQWHSSPDEVRYSRYLTETTIDESKWNANYPIFGMITLCGVLLWILFNASWSFYGFSCLVDISGASPNDSKNIDLGTWSLTYIDSSLGLLICFVPIVVFILLATLTAAFALLLGVFACLFSCTYHSVPDIVED